MNYLYNGVMAPTLPERDEEKYPYVIVGGSNPENPSPGSPIEMHAFFDPTLYQGALFSPYIKCEPSGNYFYAYVYEGEWKVHTPANTDVVSFTDNIRWTNVDLYNPDGTLFLAASDPIPVSAPQLDPLSLFMGWKAGNWVARQRGKKAEEEKTPIAYLYNGVRLPNISAVWTDKTAYPYAVIFHFDGAILGYPDAKIYQLALCIDEWQYDGSAFTTSGKVTGYIFTDTQVVADAFGVEVGVWGVAETIDNGVSTTGAPVWTSHDILNSDGTIYLAASEPVPVYE